MSFFSTATGVAVVDTRTRPGTITLPLTSQIPNRYLQIKDLYGSFGRSSLTLSTQSGETFDDGTTSKILTDPFTFFTLYAASTTRWAQLGGTQTIQQTVSSLNVSSITIGTGIGWLQLPPIQTIALSTNTITGDNITVNSTTSYYMSAQILYVSSIMGAVVGGGTGDVTKANLISTTANLQSAATQFVSSLTVNALTVGSGAGWLQLPPVQSIYVSTTYTQAQALFAVSSYFGGTSTATTLEYWGLFGNYNNTVLAEISTGGGFQEFLVFKGSSSSDRVRVQTTGNFVIETGVSARLWNDNTTTTLANATPAFIINTSSNVGIQTATPGATLDVAGTGRAVTFSSQQLFFSSVNGGLPLSLSNLTSTTAGITTAYQTAGFISSANLANMVSTSFLDTTLASTTTGITTAYQTAGFISSANLANMVSTSFLDTTLASTTTGITIAYQSAGFLSSANLLNMVSTTFLDTSLISTTNFINQSFSSFSTGIGSGSSGGLTAANLTSTVTGLGSIGYISSTSLTSTVRGLGSIGYISTIPTTASTSAFLTSSITASTITTSSLQVNSLTIGTGTGWLNLGPIQTTIISTLQETTNALYANTAYIGIQSTVNSIQYNGLFGNYNNTVLAEISTGGGFQEFLVFKGSSSSDRVRVQTTGNFVIETGVSARLWSNTTIPTQSNVTPAFIINSSSNVGIQTATPGATLDVAGSVRAVTLSSQQLFFSSVNGSLPLGITNITSTVRGLGSSGYISSIPAIVGTSTFTASTIATSSLQVNSLTIGTGTGWVNLGPLQTVYISSFQDTTNALYAANAYIGIQSTVNALAYNGLFGNYNNTVLAEISTGAGFQELLMFKGSSSSDRVRVQTTGNFVIETGVSARLWSNTTIPTQSNATPAFIINSSSNVGIQTGSPGATLDVAGTTRAVTVSSQQLFFSSVNGGLPLSAANLTSTTAGLQSNIEGWSQYPTTTDVTFASGTGILPANLITSFQIKADNLLVRDVNGGYGNFSMGNILTMNTSTTVESYSLGFSDIPTGSISSFGFTRSDGVTIESAALYMSSLYLGNFGGTTAGQLTTDATATDLFWKGSKLNNQGGGGGGGAIDYVSAFTVSTSYLQVSSISSYYIETYGVIGNAFFNTGPDEMFITTVNSGTISAYSNFTIYPSYDLTLNAPQSTIATTGTFFLNSSNDVRAIAPSNIFFDTPLVQTSNIFNTDTISTYSLAVFGPQTLTVNGVANLTQVNLSSINGQAFSGNYVCVGKLTANETIPATTDTVLPFSVDIDPNGWLQDPGSNIARFQPTLNGYYNITFQALWARSFGGGGDIISIRKNGTSQIATAQAEVASNADNSLTTTKIVNLNGSSDYVDFVTYTDATPSQDVLYAGTDSPGTFFSAFYIH